MVVNLRGQHESGTETAARTLYIFSLEIFSSSFEVIFFSTARTMPSLASIPTQIPACEIASIAYSTWYRRPSGEKVVVLESYRLAYRSKSTANGLRKWIAGYHAGEELGDSGQIWESCWIWRIISFEKMVSKFVSIHVPSWTTARLLIAIISIPPNHYHFLQSPIDKHMKMPFLVEQHTFNMWNLPDYVKYHASYAASRSKRWHPHHSLSIQFSK